MGLAVRWFSAIVVLVSLPMGGCIHGTGQRSTSVSKAAGTVHVPSTLDSTGSVPSTSLPDSKSRVPPAPSEAVQDETPTVMQAVAWEESDVSGRIVQTGGIFDKPAEAVKQGVNKVTDAITPTPQVTPADDPTLLSTKSKPTPELHLSMAKYQEELGKPALAEQSYQQALRMAPKHLAAHLAYARFKERQGQTREALQLCQKAAKLWPNESAVFNDMGLIYARHGMNAEAMAAFSRAIEMQPKRALYRNNMAALLVETGHSDQAMKQLASAYPEADACYKLGFLLQAKGDTQRAVGAFSRALALNPSMNEARRWLDHLRSEPASAPRVSRRPSGVGNSAASPRSNGQAVRTPLPQQQETLPAQRAPVRQLPPVTNPLSEPTPERLPEPGPASTPAPGPVPWPRRLPPTSAERPVAHTASPADRTNEVRPLDMTVDDVPDAPLPTAHPRGHASQ